MLLSYILSIDFQVTKIILLSSSLTNEKKAKINLHDLKILLLIKL